mmetsp:Transcript_19791/g.63647  ORF Transcript_19791/g.63647 Transcript_19791/m.63647 type:complete len:164 (+) Transcript_19791:69-560(+)
MKASTACGVATCMVALWYSALQRGFGLQAGLVLAMAAILLFGTRVRFADCLGYDPSSLCQEKARSEPSAYSVFNSGHARLAGQFTAEQFDAQLRGNAQRPDANIVPLGVVDAGHGHRLGGAKEQDQKDDATTRRRLFAEAAERRGASSSTPKDNDDDVVEGKS